MNQEEIYKRYESDAFYERVKGNITDDLRENKKEIKILLERNIDLYKYEVLEVGCFIGDLLNSMDKEYNCKVRGIEASTKACEYALKKYNLQIENKLFLESELLKNESKKKFDLIIIDDVLSWMDRGTILRTVGNIDHLLKESGYLFIRDFCPANNFAYKNHHVKGDEVFNYKQAGGHKQFFLMTGCYTIEEEFVRKNKKYQKKESMRNDSTIWSDTLLRKHERANHPLIEM